LYAAALLGPAVALAADFPSAQPRPVAPPVVAVAPAVSYAYDPYRWEIRAGAMAHGVGSVERKTVDLTADVISPRLWQVAPVWWDFLIPRVRIGGAVNLNGRTNVLYADALFSVPLWDRWFVEAFVGPSVHDGKLIGDGLRHANLGCRALFHAGGSVGFVPIPRWNVTFTFEHLSNGNSLFGIGCDHNQGLNNYGAKIGYSF
jgi:hypothetical protein